MAEKKKTYDTELSADDEKVYKDWARTNKREADEADYDMRGWWNENRALGVPAQGEHFTDKYKKPNHPTFSKESQYHGKDGHEGGEWGEKDGKTVFKPSKSNLKNLGRDGLQKYFKEVEPDAVLDLPKTRAEKRYGK